ncbi:MAG: hypothetical protein ISS00_01625, partial [Candidatus Marinimicrobia bacterium]|nr:hypothetical protein [Candidatus Neomarinimicrobiota bacterium]
DERVIKTSIALQHLDNIWDRKAKGLYKNKPKQLANFYAEPIELNLGHIIIEYYTDYLKIKDSIKFTYNNSSKNNLPSEKKWWSFLTQRSGK